MTQGTAWHGAVRRGITFMFQGGAVHGRVKLGKPWLGGARLGKAWRGFSFYALGRVTQGKARWGTVW